MLKWVKKTKDVKSGSNPMKQWQEIQTADDPNSCYLPLKQLPQPCQNTSPKQANRAYLKQTSLWTLQHLSISQLFIPLFFADTNTEITLSLGR